MVAASHGTGAHAGITMLQAGGNAVDAAVAVQFALAVVEFQHVSLFGGGALVYQPPSGVPLHIDFREEAPTLYHPKTFCNNTKCLLDPDCDCSSGPVSDSERCVGAHATGVPGVPGLLIKLVEEGLTSLPLSQLAAPAIKLAEEGFVMYEGLHMAIAQSASKLARDDAASKVFLTDDRSGPKAAIGELFFQPDLAETLRRYFTSVDGLREVYQGSLADEIIAASRRGVNPVTQKYGLLASEDLKGYKAVRREAVRYTYHDSAGRPFNITGANMPFSGPTSLRLILGYMEHLNMRTDDEVQRWSFFLDAQNAAFADRNAYMADADFVDVPMEGLLSEAYLRTRIQELFPAGHTRALASPVAPGAPPGKATARAASLYTPEYGTSHMSIASADGGVLAMTTTVNGIMGSMVVVPGRGAILNNQLCDFDKLGFDKEGKMTANAPEGGKRPRRTSLDAQDEPGGKRPRSSMSPVVVAAPGGGAFDIGAFGAPGGSDIIGGLANVLRRVLDPNFSDLSMLQALTDAPRAIAQNWASQSGMLELSLWQEPGMAEGLLALGHNLSHAPPPPYFIGETFARVQSAVIKKLAGGAVDIAGAADSLRFPECVAEGEGETGERLHFLFA